MKNQKVATKAVETKAVATKAVANVEKAEVEPSAIVASLQELQALFIECNVLPKYTDGTNYVGCGSSKCNEFSVNLKKTKYNIYATDELFDGVATGEYVNTAFFRGANSSDKKRPNTIECKSTEDLKAMLKVLASVKPALALAKAQ